MLKPNDLAFDALALKANLMQRHGADLGALVFEAQMNRRQVQDDRAGELAAQFAAVQSQMSTLLLAAGEQRAKSAAREQAKYSEYLAILAEGTKADDAAQVPIAALRARSREIQEELRAIAAPRLSERELSDLALFDSRNAERLRDREEKYPPPKVEPPDTLGNLKMNMSPLGQPRRS